MTTNERKYRIDDERYFQLDVEDDHITVWLINTTFGEDFIEDSMVFDRKAWNLFKWIQKETSFPSGVFMPPAGTKEEVF